MGAIRVNKHGDGVIIDCFNQMAIDGELFTFYIEDTDLDIVDTKDTLIVTGKNDVRISLELQAFGGQVVAEIYEDTVTSDNGTPVYVSAFNRNVTKRPDMKVFSAPTVVSLGEKFVSRRVLSYAQGNSAIVSSTSTGAFRTLKARTKYLFRQKSVADNTAITLVGTYFEVEAL